MAELASLGAKVLHTRSVEVAQKYGVELVVRSSLTREEGTVVKEDSKVEKMLISGVTSEKDQAIITIRGIEDQPGSAFEVFSILEKHNISVDIIVQSNGANNTTAISFTVSAGDKDEAVKILEENRHLIHAQDITSTTGVAKVSIVGAGMATHPGCCKPYVRSSL